MLSSRGRSSEVLFYVMFADRCKSFISSRQIFRWNSFSLTLGNTFTRWSASSTSRRRYSSTFRSLLTCLMRGKLLTGSGSSALLMPTVCFRLQFAPKFEGCGLYVRFAIQLLTMEAGHYWIFTLLMFSLFMLLVLLFCCSAAHICSSLYNLTVNRCQCAWCATAMQICSNNSQFLTVRHVLWYRKYDSCLCFFIDRIIFLL